MTRQNEPDPVISGLPHAPPLVNECPQSMKRSPIHAVVRSHAFEIGAFGDREALEVAAQAVEAELDGAEADPLAAAIDARAARLDPLLGVDCEIDAAAEIDA